MHNVRWQAKTEGDYAVISFVKGEAQVILYTDLPSGRYYADGPDTFKMFTSENYEKVDLG